MKHFRLVLLFGAFSSAGIAVPAEIAPQDGCHRFIAEISSCRDAVETRLCAFVKRRSLSGRRYLILKSPWTGMLKALNLPHNRLALTGDVKGPHFRPVRRPRLYAPSPDELFDDRGDVARLEEKECR